MKFYYKVIAEGYIEAEDEDDVKNKLEDEKVWNLDGVKITVTPEDDCWEKDSYETLGLSQKDFI